VFSLQAIKSLTCGDGGLILSPNQEHYKLAKLLRWYGLDRESSASFRCSQNAKNFGFKFHMNDINAAIGISNLKHLERVVSAHQKNAAFLNDTFVGFAERRV
jgi:dTDP-4-amino-4,6-dideoxygalactose transaminase